MNWDDIEKQIDKLIKKEKKEKEEKEKKRDKIIDSVNPVIDKLLDFSTDDNLINPAFLKTEENITNTSSLDTSLLKEKQEVPVIAAGQTPVVEEIPMEPTIIKPMIQETFPIQESNSEIKEIDMTEENNQSDEKPNVQVVSEIATAESLEMKKNNDETNELPRINKIQATELYRIHVIQQSVTKRELSKKLIQMETFQLLYNVLVFKTFENKITRVNLLEESSNINHFFISVINNNNKQLLEYIKYLENIYSFSNIEPLINEIKKKSNFLEVMIKNNVEEIVSIYNIIKEYLIIEKLLINLTKYFEVEMSEIKWESVKNTLIILQKKSSVINKKEAILGCIANSLVNPIIIEKANKTKSNQNLLTLWTKIGKIAKIDLKLEEIQKYLGDNNFEFIKKIKDLPTKDLIQILLILQKMKTEKEKYTRENSEEIETEIAESKLIYFE